MLPAPARRPPPLPSLAPLAAALAACAGGAAPAQERPTDAAPGPRPPVAAPVRAEEVDLELRFELRAEPALEVWIEVGARGADADHSWFLCAADWGGVSAGGADLSELAASDADGAPLPVARDASHRWVVEHEPGETVRLRYVVRASEHRRASSPSTYRRPVLDEELFRVFGHLGLVLPDHLDRRAPLVARLVWDGFAEAGWSVVTSFGEGDATRTVRTTGAELAHSLYVAGRLRVLRRVVHGHPLTVTLVGDEWELRDEDFADLAASVVRAQREFFADFERPFYWIALTPVGRPTEHRGNMGGTSLRNCFALSLVPNATLAPPWGEEIRRLLAHEMFHEWNGMVVEREQPEELVYWFSEGFTDFYARRLLRRDGALDAEGYARSLNRSLAEYFRSPVRGATNERVLAEFWTDPDVARLPYLRGDVVALLVDAAIRARSGGAESLDELMRDLVRAARERGQRVSTELLLAEFAARGGPEVAEHARAILLEGATPRLPADAFAPCLELETVLLRAWDPGFDLDASLAEGKVGGVRPGSAAADAGLADGQRLSGWSVHRGDPSRPLVLEVEGDEGLRELSFLPEGEAVPTPQFRVVADGADCAAL